MSWASGTKISLEDVDALRVERGTDRLTRFNPLGPLCLLLLSAVVLAAIVMMLRNSGVTLGTLFSQPIYPNGPDGKSKSIFVILPLAAFFLYLAVWMLGLLFHWAKRSGQPPLIVTETNVEFAGHSYARAQVRHFELQGRMIHGLFAMALVTGEIRRFPTAFVVGPPVCDMESPEAPEGRGFVRYLILMKIGAAMGGLLLFLAFVLF